ALLVAEVLGHRHAGETDAQTRARRLVHLAEHHHGLRDDAGLRHFAIEIVAFARALAHAGEHREAAVLRRDVANQLLDEHGLAHAGAAEQPDLAAALIRREQVDDLDARLEQLLLGLLLVERGCRTMERIPLFRVHRPLAVDRVADEVEDAPETLLSDRHRDRRTRV